MVTRKIRSDGNERGILVYSYTLFLLIASPRPPQRTPEGHNANH